MRAHLNLQEGIYYKGSAKVRIHHLVASSSKAIFDVGCLTYLLYFDHTASKAIGTEMHAYTIGNFHATELR
jgi:hypothetical protein